MTLSSRIEAVRSRAWLGSRGRLIVQTGGWSLIAKAATAANLFISVPFVLHTLGPVEFGAWATLVSLVAFAGFLDFGFGNGTMNLVAAAHGRDNKDEIRDVVHEGRRTLTQIALGLAIVAAIALPWVPWHRILGLPLASAQACRWASASVLFAIALAVPLNLATRVQLGIGRGDRAFRWQVAGQIATLGLVIALACANASLPLLTAASVFTPLLAALANTVGLFRDPHFSRPLTKRPDIGLRIRREGILFFVLQLAAALAYSADLPLISALRGPADAGTYLIVQRLFSIVPMGLDLLWTPLWPIYRQSLASGNHDWVLRTLRRSILFTVASACIVATGIALGFEHIAGLWIHEPVAVSGMLLTAFTLWCMTDAVGRSLATFLNAASIMRFQVIVGSTFAILCFSCKVLAVAYVGAWALPWVACVTFIVANLIPTLIFFPRLIAASMAKIY